jgi:hypothetical protein
LAPECWLRGADCWMQVVCAFAAQVRECGV